jgi:hypothetical protein
MGSPLHSTSVPLLRQPSAPSELEHSSQCLRHDHDGRACTPQSFVVPITPHRISAVFLSLTFILSKGIVVYRNLERASPALDCIFGMAALVYVSFPSNQE